MTRRDWLVAALSVVAPPPKKRAAQLPNAGEFFRFLDPLTETPVVRLTSATSASLLPAPPNPFVSVKDRFLIFSSDRTGALTPFRLDLHSGALTPLAHTSKLDARSLCLDAHRKLVYLLDDGALQEIALGSKKVRSVATGVSAFAVAASGFVVVRESRLEYLSPAGPIVLAQDVAPWCLLRPDGKSCLFGRVQDMPFGRSFWHVSLEGSSPKPVQLASGQIWNPLWSPAGDSVLFLRITTGGNSLGRREIRELSLDSGTERVVAPSTQFSCFSLNGNGSVLVGATDSRAQPSVVLFIRSAQRELTICEHRSADASSVSPVFSPDSRRVYFESQLIEGPYLGQNQSKSALYSVNVESLVEPTAPTAI